MVYSGNGLVIISVLCLLWSAHLGLEGVSSILPSVVVALGIVGVTGIDSILVSVGLSLVVTVTLLTASPSVV